MKSRYGKIDRLLPEFIRTSLGGTWIWNPLSGISKPDEISNS
jgi:hypothetical protein